MYLKNKLNVKKVSNTLGNERNQESKMEVKDQDQKMARRLQRHLHV